MAVAYLKNEKLASSMILYMPFNIRLSTQSRHAGVRRNFTLMFYEFMVLPRLISKAPFLFCSFKQNTKWALEIRLGFAMYI